MDPDLSGIDLENWMRNLPDELKDKPVYDLSIPGSHNSGTCDLSSHAGNDAFGVNIAIFARRWAACQHLTIYHQLVHGIRYLDLRIDFDVGKSEFYLTHFLRAKSSPETCLDNVKRFLEEHPKEVVIIDFQHFYNFSNTQKEKFLTSVLEQLGSMICPVPRLDDGSPNCKTLTLSYMYGHKYQVILINRFKTNEVNDNFFTTRDFPTFWPNTDNGSKVIENANIIGCELHNCFGYITQLVLTVQGAKNLFYLNLEMFHKSRLLKKALNWLYNIQADQRPNIVITDFVELMDFAFPSAVVKLNYLKDGEALVEFGKIV